MEMCGLSTMTTGLLGLFTAIVIYVIYKFHINHYWKKTGIPYAKFFPLLGYTVELMKGKSFHQLDEELYKKYGKIFGSYEGPNPVLFVSDPELIKDIFVKDFHSFVNRRRFDTWDPILANMVSLLRDEEWKRVRSIISPTFTTGKLKGMTHNIANCATKSIENFMIHAESGKPVECKKLFGNYTLDVIASVAFGTQLDSHNDPDNMFVTEARRVFNRNVGLRMLLILFIPRIAKIMKVEFIPTRFFAELVKEIIKRRRNKQEVRNDFLQMVMEKLDDPESLNKIKTSENIAKVGTTNGTMSNKIHAAKMTITELDQNEDDQSTHNIKNQIVYSTKTLSLNELLGQSLLFFLAGYDTTATTLSMVCHNLAHNHDAQKKVQMEVDDIWNKMIPLEAITTSETRYIDAVIKETLRLYPPLVRLERQASEDYPLRNTGFVIPKGMLVTMPIYPLQRDPEYFSEPEKFLPERFLPENIGSIIPFTYLPFGDGPRNCVAMRLALMEIKLNLIHLLKEVEFDLCPQTKSPPDFYNGNGFLQPKGVYLKVTKRTVTVT